MKFFYHPASQNCRKVDATLRHLGIEVERVVVDLAQGAHRSPEFLARNANGKIPVLETEGRSLWESNAIMIHLAEAQAAQTLYPTGPERVDVLRWLFWETAHFSPACAMVTYERVVKKLLEIGPPDEGVVAEGLQRFGRFAKVLDGQLEGRAYVLGETLSLADFALAADLSYAAMAELPLADHPQLARWLSSLDELPAWRQTAPKLG